MSEALDDGETALWHAFKRAGEDVRARIAEEITRETGLSDPDFGLLTRIEDAGGRLRQNELAASVHWHRSRLSHQLTRMTGRGLVERDPAEPGVDVLITARGRELVTRARPVHAAAVRRHLLAAVAPADRDATTAWLIRLAAGGPFTTPSA